MTRAAFSAVVIPMTRPPTRASQARANSAMVRVFPGARGRGEDGHQRPRGEQPDYCVALFGAQGGAVERLLSLRLG